MENYRWNGGQDWKKYYISHQKLFLLINLVTTPEERNIFKLVLIIAYISAIAFSLFYYYHEVYEIYYNGIFCFFLFVIYGIASYFTTNLVWLFRCAIITAFYAFYFQVFYTGGVLSPALTEFIIPPAIAFFYRPARDRGYFMVLSVICILSMWLLTDLGYTQNKFPPNYLAVMTVISTLFVFSMIGIHIYLYRRLINAKNIELERSYQELQTTTQKLIEAEKMASLGVLSAGVAHEINNPLNFIKGGAEVLSMQMNSNEMRPAVKAIEEGVKRATAIVSSLAHFSRNTVAMDEFCDIHKIVDNCLVMLEHRLKHRVEVIREYVDLQGKRILGNEGKLHQALLNILANAEQSIEEKGVITIRTAIEDSRLRVIVSDTGKGISPQHLTMIKEPFFTTKPSGEGTGLGLSITYKVIQEHGGDIAVESKVAEGTHFHISFKNLEELTLN